MTNSADPDQLASSESGSTLFAKTGHVVFSKRKVNTLYFMCIAPNLDKMNISLFLHRNLFCQYLLELSHWGSVNV